MKTIRVAIVGCGRISDLHQIGYRGREDAKIVAVCDTNKGHARDKAQAWGVEKVYTDYAQVLNDKDVDVVELLTPHHLHCSMTVQAAEAGKHVSVQKPMALTAAEADKMIAAAHKAGVRQTNDRGGRDRRGARHSNARQQRDERHILESAAHRVAVALQRETVRRRSARL